MGGFGERVSYVDKVWGVMVFRACLALVALFGVNHSATATSGNGRAFDCSFQTGRLTLERLTVWYGASKASQGATPQFDDPAKLFVLKGTAVGTNLTFHVSDDWPTRFTINYFERDKGTSPLALFVIHGDGNLGEDFIAEVAQFAPNAPRDMTIKPVKRLYGACKVTPEITWDTFRTRPTQ